MENEDSEAEVIWDESGCGSGAGIAREKKRIEQKAENKYDTTKLTRQRVYRIGDDIKDREEKNALFYAND